MTRRRDDWTEEKLEQLYRRIDQTRLVCGIDEVGRGPIAGPVVACAIIMPNGERIDGVTDSKKLSEKKRELLYDRILDHAIAWGIGRVDERVIDEINIRQATLLAMKEALSHLRDRHGARVVPQLVLIDAERIETNLPQISVIKGDLRVYAISCASIVAKVVRDREMREMAQEHPAYGFEKHKGYGTKLHYEAIRKHGLLPVHRRSFIHGEDLVKHDEQPKQSACPSEDCCR